MRIASNYRYEGLEFRVYGVKNIETNRFESCDPNEPGVIGWQVSYGGRAFCPLVARTHCELDALISCLAVMYREGQNDMQYSIKKALGVV